MHRFFVKIKNTSQIEIPQETIKHINVLKIKKKENITVFNGDGYDYLCQVQEISKKTVELEIQSKKINNTESNIKIELGQAIIKGNRMDTAIQKAVELGVAKITPIYSQRCNVKICNDRMENKIEHWQKVVNSACEQCNRSIIPVINKPMQLSDWVAIQTQATKIVLNPTADKYMQTSNTSENIKLLIGSEGGLTQEEIDLAVSNGFQSIKLGPRILRAETAAIAAITAVQLKYGDLSSN